MWGLLCPLGRILSEWKEAHLQRSSSKGSEILKQTWHTRWYQTDGHLSFVGFLPSWGRSQCDLCLTLQHAFYHGQLQTPSATAVPALITSSTCVFTWCQPLGYGSNSVPYPMM